MYSLRYILPAVATARLAAAACSGTSTIQNSGDASAIAQACSTFSGTIAVATQAADELKLDGLQEIDGDLVVKNANDLGSIGADSLTTITGKFMLSGVRQLTNLEFPELTEVGSIEWRTLPNLNGLSFGAGIQKASTVSITDTQLQDLSGLALSEADTITLQSNGILTNVSFDLEKIGTGFTVSENGQDMELSMPSLTKAKNLILQDLGSLNLPELETVGGELDVERGSFETLEIPKLTEVGTTLTIRENSQLSEIMLEQLKTVSGGFVIAQNPQLSTIGGLPKLETINGNLDFTGNFEEVDLPKLSSVKGAFNMQSQGDIARICNEFESQNGRNLPIRGKFTCRTDEDPKELEDSEGSGSGSGGSDSEDSGLSLNIPTVAVMGLAGVLMTIFGML